VKVAHAVVTGALDLAAGAELVLVPRLIERATSGPGAYP
jgi:hypothetical protein